MPSPWTKERVEFLRAHYGTMSASEIAIAMSCGISRNSVIGKCHRLGLTKKPMRVAAAMRKARRQASPPVRNAPKPPLPAAPAGPISLIVCEPVRMIDTTSQHCRWPVDKGTRQGLDFWCCGAPIIGGSFFPERPYCAHHTAKAKSKAEPKTLSPAAREILLRGRAKSKSHSSAFPMKMTAGAFA